MPAGRTAHDSNSSVVATGMCHVFIWSLRLRAIVPQCRKAAAPRVWELLLPGEDAAIQECEKLLNGIKDSPAAFIWL